MIKLKAHSFVFGFVFLPVVVAMAGEYSNLTAECIATDLRIRSRPSLDSPVLGAIHKGEKVNVFERSHFSETISDKTNYWYRINTKDGKSGFVFGDYIDISVENIPPLHSTIALSGVSSIWADFPIKTGQTWFALRSAPGGSFLESHEIIVTMEDPGKNVTFQDDGETKDVIVLIRGLPSYKIGAIPFVKLVQPFSEAGDVPRDMNFSFNGHKYSLRQSTYSITRTYKTNSGTESRIELQTESTFESDGKIQVLNTTDNYGKFSFSWVGDIDDDGEIDLVCTFDGDKGGYTCLYLSSFASGTNPLAEVASFMFGC